jgi:hypothetical protein
VPAWLHDREMAPDLLAAEELLRDGIDEHIADLR